MKFTTTKRALVRAMTQIAPYAVNKGTMPSLRNVLLVLDDSGSLRLAATDLEVSGFGTLAVTDSEPGSIAVCARDLADRAKLLPDGPVTVALVDSGLVVRGGARKYTLHTMPAADMVDFPEPPKNDPSCQLAAATLAHLARTVVKVVADDRTRMHLHCALFEVDAKGLRMVATDGHRLALSEIPLTEVVGSKPKPCAELIVKKGVEALMVHAARLVEDADEEEHPAISVVLDRKYLHFVSEGFRVSVKKPGEDVRFPPYGQVIPDGHKYTARVSRAVLISSLRSVSVVTEKVAWLFTPGQLTLRAQGGDEGDGEDTIEIESKAKLPEAIGLETRYVLHALEACDEDSITLEFTGPLDPVCFVQTTRAHFALVMPMRI